MIGALGQPRIRGTNDLGRSLWSALRSSLPLCRLVHGTHHSAGRWRTVNHASRLLAIGAMRPNFAARARG